jgi:hypothetical protein
VRNSPLPVDCRQYALQKVSLISFLIVYLNIDLIRIEDSPYYIKGLHLIQLICPVLGMGVRKNIGSIFEVLGV